MAALHLENVSDDLLQKIERLAERERQTPKETILHLLEEAARNVREGLSSFPRGRFWFVNTSHAEVIEAGRPVRFL